MKKSTAITLTVLAGLVVLTGIVALTMTGGLGGKSTYYKDNTGATKTDAETKFATLMKNYGYGSITNLDYQTLSVDDSYTVTKYLFDYKAKSDYPDYLIKNYAQYPSRDSNNNNQKDWKFIKTDCKEMVSKLTDWDLLKIDTNNKVCLNGGIDGYDNYVIYDTKSEATRHYLQVVRLGGVE
jgi:hypothetical protein